MKNQEIICIGCPLGCHVVLTINENGEICKFIGNECKAGEKYVAQEFKDPARVFTGTVRTKECSTRLLPVRTNKPIPKTSVLICGRSLAGIEVKPPVKMGDLIVTNILNTGADLIATCDLYN